MSESPAFPPMRPVALAQRDGRPPVTLAVHEQGEGPAVVFCHGFPELAYSWRHQLPAVAAAGFRAIAPDQRGYGESSRPEPFADYGIRNLTGDLVGLLDALGIEKAVFVGHDWGGLVTWAMPVLHPERCAGIAGVCTPYIPFPDLEAIRKAFAGEDERFYILWFQEPGRAEGEMDAQVRAIFEGLMRRPQPPEEVARRMLASGKPNLNPFRNLEQLREVTTELCVTPDELEVYVRTFERTGFAGGINWYRNMTRNGVEHPEIGRQKLELPCLMITAAWDMALRPELAAGMPALCSDLEMHNIERAGHWVQQEMPDAVNALLVDWLRRRFGAGRRS
jgi:pimeloyl-ACP methyl ester carboxylesterase